jgi:glyoxylase-like metal-dependent hydrolase (beta-lactamase superfamily II)
VKQHLTSTEDFTAMVRPCAFAGMLMVAATVHAQNPASVHFHVEKLADGVYAAIASDTGFAICNAGIVDLGDGTLVFDPFMSPRAGSDLRQAAVALTGKPVTYVINSHYHNDHIRGNQEFAGARIISTLWTRQAMAESEPEEISWEKENAAKKVLEERQALARESDIGRRTEDKFWVKYYETLVESQGSYHTVLPDVTFEGKLVLHGPKRGAELIDIGKGHTNSDLILYLPSERIVFTGDLLFVKRHPYLPDGSPDDWLRALERITALGIRTAVPGHGPVGDSTDICKPD